jgi:hypothetical protein
MSTNQTYLPRVKDARVLHPYVIEVTFTDGTRRRIDLADEIWGTVFEPLENPDYFTLQMYVGTGSIEWPSGASIAPEALYEMGEVIEEPASNRVA